MPEDVLVVMERIRADGWCVVLKALPDGFPWIIEGSRSEYDAPFPDQHVIRKWCCEAQDVSWTADRPYPRRSQSYCHDDPAVAVLMVEREIERERERLSEGTRPAV